MTHFQDVFSRRHVVLPVIHVTDEDQALRNTQIAREARADGVFLINHAISSEDLLAVHRKVVDEHPDWWVGVNCLDLSPVKALGRVDDSVAGVWVDNAMIDENADRQPDADRVLQTRRHTGWPGLYFGGVAFKYQRPVRDLARAATVAARYMDVVTTSGPGTGMAAGPDKIRAMKEALGDRPLAIASGITPENVRGYLDIADCFLVATGIGRSFEELDADRVAALVAEVRSAEGA